MAPVSNDPASTRGLAAGSPAEPSDRGDPSGPAYAPRWIGVTVLVPVVVAVVLTLFAWPAGQLAPRELPIGLAGPPPATEALANRLAAGGAFDVHRYADESAARAAIRSREVYGAVVVGPDEITVLTASAASPVVAQLLSTGIAEQMRTPSRPAVRLARPVTQARRRRGSSTSSPRPAGTREARCWPRPSCHWWWEACWRASLSGR